MCQTKYCLELLKKIRLVSGKEIFTPMATNGNLDKDEKGKDIKVKAIDI